jgi:hypothetical protein
MGRSASRHHFNIGRIRPSYDVFARPAETGALKVVLSRTAMAALTARAGVLGEGAWCRSGWRAG